MQQNIGENTALVKVRPQADEVVIALHEQSLRLETFAEALIITSDDDIKSATNDLSIISGLKKAIEEKRKEYTQPINEHLKAVNEAFKTFTEPLERADRITRDKVIEYRQEQERQRREQDEINRLRIEAAQKEMELKGELTESVELVEVSPEAPKRVSTDMGTISQRMIRKWKLLDMSLVPEEYKILDSAKITKVVKAGIPSIAGIRIYEEPILAVTTKKEG